MVNSLKIERDDSGFGRAEKKRTKELLSGIQVPRTKIIDYYLPKLTKNCTVDVNRVGNYLKPRKRSINAVVP